jgi:hypothetical protein
MRLMLALALTLGSQAVAVTRSEAIARARAWVDAQLPYCQCPNGGFDSHGQCNRTSNPEWDAYRTDCSGLVSWSWGLPAPGRVTWTLAPYDNSVSYEIAIGDLQPGDALNTNEGGHEHVALFMEWAGSNVAHVIEESNWGTPAHDSYWNLTPVGNTLVSWATFHPIRSTSVTEDCQAHCEGSVVVGSDCGRGDCAPYGANCVDDGLGARCVFFACPATGTVDVCMPDGKTIIHCENGQLTSSGDCSQYAAYCSTQGSGLAHCASLFCASPKAAPKPHDLCGLGSDLAHCDESGALTSTVCPSGQHCTVAGAQPACVNDTGCPASGEVWQCGNGHVEHCYDGNLIEDLNCIAQGEVCQRSAGRASCVGVHAGNPEDAGVRRGADAGVTTLADGGVGPIGPTGGHELVGGVGCSSTPAGAMVGLALVGLLRRRRVAREFSRVGGRAWPSVR